MLVVISATFFMVHAAPGGPFDDDRVASPEILKQLNETYNLNDPLIKQLGNYLLNALQGDFGPSYKYPGRTVSELIASGLPITAGNPSLRAKVNAIVNIPIDSFSCSFS